MIEQEPNLQMTNNALDNKPADLNSEKAPNNNTISIYIPKGVLIILFVCLILGGAVFLFLSQKDYYGNLFKQKLPAKKPDTIQSPISTIFGRIEQVKNGEIFVAASNPSTQQLITYAVKISSQTRITRRPVTIPYILKQDSVTPTLIPASSQDLVKGMAVELVTKNDVSKKEITADSLVLPRITYVLQGTIETINESSIIVDAAPVPEMPLDPTDNRPPPHRQYTVTIIPETEISRQPGNENPEEPSTAEQLTLSDLSAGQMVTVYSTDDVIANSIVVAGRIEPITQ